MRTVFFISFFISNLLCHGQDSTRVQFAVGVNTYNLNIHDAFHRDNGNIGGPTIQIQFTHLILNATPLFSLSNGLKHQQYGVCGAALNAAVLLNKNTQALRWGIHYNMAWQRFLPSNATHYIKGNYSMMHTFGYYINFALQNRWIIQHASGIGTGFGESTQQTTSLNGYKGTAYLINIGLLYKL